NTIEVTWPDGKKTVQANIKANSFLKINYSDSNLIKPAKKITEPAALFTNLSPSSLGIDYKDKHPDFIDFNYERLMPRKYSENGQGIAVADVNNDGLEDFFVGGAFQQTGKIYVQDKKGHFS